MARRPRKTPPPPPRPTALQKVAAPLPEGLPGGDLCAEITRVVAAADDHIIGKAQASTGARKVI